MKEMWSPALLLFLPGVLSVDFKCPTPKGQFRHELNCEKFYNCWENVAIVDSCPLGLLYEDVRNICLDADKVDCGDREVPEIDYKPTPECPEPVGLFPVKGSCTSYNHCVGGKPFLRHCPPGQQYNPQGKMCDWPERVKCREGEDRTTPVIDVDENLSTKRPDDISRPPVVHTDGPVATKPPGGVTCPEPTGLFPHPNEENKFISCVGGVGTIQKCPAGLKFNPTIKACDW